MKAKLFMKSGNTMVITDLVDLSIKYTGDLITSLNVEFENNASPTGIMISSICLAQIEGIEIV